MIQLKIRLNVTCSDNSMSSCVSCNHSTCTLPAAEIPDGSAAMFLAALAIALANSASKPMGYTEPPQGPTSQEAKRDVDETMKSVKEAMMAIEASVNSQ